MNPLCPEHEFREGLGEEDFWDHVLRARETPEMVQAWRDDYHALHQYARAVTAERDALLAEEDSPPIGYGTFEPCPECGEVGACGVDSLGREMVHVIREEVEE